jgi:threonine dehydratase
MMQPQQSMPLEIPTLDDIRGAAGRIAGRAHRTPVLTCSGLDALTGAKLFLKCENLQRVGAFKFRGACNAVSLLTPEEARNGVLTHSSGNHAAALALAAAERGVPAHIVMPKNTAAVKQRAVAAYGGRIVLCEPTLPARHETADRIARETGAVMVHPYDNCAVMAGQGTVALEFLEQQPGLDIIIAPVSGGGLLSGIALATAATSPDTALWGAEPEQADDAYQSLRAGRLMPLASAQTIADGLRAALSERTFAVIRRHVRDIITVSETEIVAAMRLIWERMKLVIEPSSAVPLAAVLKRKDFFPGRRVGVVLTGGNLDLERLPWQTSL